MNQMSESAVPLVLSRITVATTLHQHVKTNLSHDGLGKCTNMDFSQRFKTQKYVFVILIRFLAVSWIQGCFHWLSNPIRSGVMADQRFSGQWHSQPKNLGGQNV